MTNVMKLSKLKIIIIYHISLQLIKVGYCPLFLNLNPE